MHDNALRIVLILLAVSLLAGAITGISLYFRLSYLWGGLLLISWGMSRLSLRGVQVNRDRARLALAGGPDLRRAL